MHPYHTIVLPRSCIFLNNDAIADRVWFFHRQSGCDRGHVLKEGLNGWPGKILNPISSTASVSLDELKLNDFRKAARSFITGGSMGLRLSHTETQRKRKRPADTKT